MRRLVGRRLERRLRALALPDLAAYRARLEAHRDEWAELDALLGIHESLPQGVAGFAPWPGARAVHRRTES